MKNYGIVLVLCIFFFVVVISLALADSYGEDTLGPPSIDIATGNGLVAEGTGMVSQPGTITFSIPDGATIKQVLLYWEGRTKITDPLPDPPGDDTILVNGTMVTGELIGGPTQFCDLCFSSSFRADITNLELVAPGNNTLELEGLEFTFIDNGAGVLVLFEDSGPDADFELFDGVDIAFWKWDEPRDSTVPQTFTFAASTTARQAQLSLFVASIIPFDEPDKIRPNSIEVTTSVDGITDTNKVVYSDELANSDGDEWDTLNLPVTIPAGANNLTVQIFSRDDKPEDPDPLRDQPASLAWITAALMVPSDEVPPEVEVSKICTPDVFVGDEIEYEITVINTGDENLTDVAVIDPLLELEEEIDSLAIGASTTVTDTMIAAEAGVITNTVTVTATGEISTGEVTDTDSCTTTVYELEVKKDAEISYVRKYQWKINKRVNETKSINLTLLPTQVVSPTYDVAIKPDYPPYVDSDWVVSGTISITNPAPIETELVANLNSVVDVISYLDVFHQYLPVISKSGQSQDADVGQNQPLITIPPGISVPVDCPSLLEVPPGETLVCTYGPVDLESSLPRTNTAVAELKNRVGGAFSGTSLFGGTAEIDFASVEPELIDEEVTVTDSMLDLSETVNIANAPRYFIFPDEPMPSFTVNECMNVDENQNPDPDSNRKQVVNTATFTTNDTGTQGSSSAEVNLYCIESASTGFEDLPLTGDNDWDYNDAFFEVGFNPAFSDSSDLESITFQFMQPVNCSANSHEFHIEPDVFACNGTYSLTRNGDPVATNAPYQNGQDLTIFDDTRLDDPDPDPDPPRYCRPEPPLNIPPSLPPPNTAELVINFDVPSPGACPLDLSEYDPIGTFNGEGLFYVPSLVVKFPSDKPEDWPKRWYTIKPNAEKPDPRIVGVPDTWPWPYENQCIWKVYPDITPADPDKGPPLFEKVEDAFWWDNYVGPNDERCPPYDE